METEYNSAILVKNACKRYDDNKVLDNVCVSVEKGTIYGLLGASGCGKTTLLTSILGRKQLDSGQILTLGTKPGTKNSGIPGPRVGYMPQEMALIPEYTVRETIFFFGRIANMEDEPINKRLLHLSRLLQLPPNNKSIQSCSGGEQRRISLAAAIVHEPELLILDEPTVGVDCILRDKIWNYLLDNVRRGITVVMTTHYIEECSMANKVGLMRNGKLLTEGSPQHIMSASGSETLEQAFLKVSLEQVLDKEEFTANLGSIDTNLHIGLERPSTSSSMQSFDIADYTSSEDLVREPSKCTNHTMKGRTFLGLNNKRLFALLHKNWTQFTRNALGMFLFGIMPVMQCLFFIYCIGGDVKNLKLGIVNDEVRQESCINYDRHLTTVPDIETFDCHFKNLSCRFLEYLDNPMIIKVYYNNTEEALEDVLHGILTGYLYISKNFSAIYEERLRDILSVDNKTLQFGTVQTYLDMSNKGTGGALKYKLMELFIDFQDDIFRDCLWNERLGKAPLNEEYLYGKKSDTFLIFMIPGLILTFGFFFSTTMTSQIIIEEKCEGVWDRCQAAGVTTFEVACGHMILQVTISILHGVLPILIIVYVYGIEYHGSVFDMIVMSFLQNTCGLALGFWISVICKNHTQSHYAVTGIMFPTLVLSGLMWPLEGLPYGLGILAKCLPNALPILAMRNIIRKGWSLWNTEVVLANMVPIAWIVGFILLSLLQIRKLN